MGAEKPELELLQNMYMEKEGYHRDHESWGIHQKSLLCLR